jgi:hypothetical protein
MFMKMNAVMANVSRFAAKAKFKLGKHSPEILMVVGAVGAVTSTVMACKATLKVNDILAAHDATVATIHDVQEGKVQIKAGEEYTEEDVKKDLTTTYVQTGLKIAKLYAPAVILGTLSIGCMFGSNHILQKRNAALTAAYVTLDKAFGDYKERVTERFGDRVQSELEHGIKAVEVESKVVNEDGTEETIKSYVDEVDGAHSPYDLIFDEMIDEWQPDAQYNKWHLAQVEDTANRRLRTQGYLFLNDVYRMIGRYNSGAMIVKPEGQIVGWLYDPNNENLQNCVKLGLDKMHGDRNVVLHFNVDGPIIDKI